MSSITNLTDRYYSRQHHILVNARYALSRAEIDIILTLLTTIHKEDKDFKDYEFTLKDLETKTNRQWNSRQLRDTAERIMSKPPLRLPKEEGKGFTLVHWFSYFDFDGKGKITCRFDKELKPYLIDIKGRWVLSDIRYILPMKSSYSKRIYLLLKEHQKFGIRKFKVEELMDMLKVPKSMKGYAQFKQKVLKKAEKDINEYTDLFVELEEKKQVRKVVEVIYHIRSNKNDFNGFKKTIREFYSDRVLLLDEKGSLACNADGLLYYKEIADQPINKEHALELWKNLFHERKNLLVFQNDLLNSVSADTRHMIQADINIKTLEELDSNEAYKTVENLYSSYANFPLNYIEPGDNDITFFFPRDSSFAEAIYGEGEDEVREKYSVPEGMKIFSLEMKAHAFMNNLSNKMVKLSENLEESQQ